MLTDLNFSNSLVGLEGDVRHRRVHHQGEQVQDEVGIPPQAQESRVTFFPERDRLLGNFGLDMFNSTFCYALEHFS